MLLYHGTDIDSAKRLLAGESLDPAKAASLKIDGPPGFFLAVERSDAEFFALRQLRGPAAVVQVDVSDAAISQLLASGAIRRPIPRGLRSPRFAGDELFIPPDLFPLFNELRNIDEIDLAAAP
jgi:hypothetical protein